MDRPSGSRNLTSKEMRTMTEQKMQKINAWMQQINKDKLEMQDKMIIATATMEMLEKLEPIYDKYNRQKKGA